MFQFSSESSASNSLQTDVYYDAQVVYSTVLRPPGQHNSAVTCDTSDTSDFNCTETSDTSNISDYNSAVILPAATIPSHQRVLPTIPKAVF